MSTKSLLQLSRNQDVPEKGHPRRRLSAGRLALQISAVAAFAVLSAASARAQRDLQATILAKERQELNCLRTGNIAEFASLLAEDAVFVDAHGAAGKAEVVKNVAAFRLQDFVMEDVRFLPLSSRSGVLIYRAGETGTSHGKPFSAEVHVSAIWVEREGKWLCVFSQESAASRPAPKLARHARWQ